MLPANTITTVVHRRKLGNPHSLDIQGGADRGLPRPWPKPVLILSILPLCEGAGVNHTGRRHRLITSEKFGKPGQFLVMLGERRANRFFTRYPRTVCDTSD